MEAVGLAASIIQLISVTTKTVKYLNNVKNATKDRARLSEEVISLLALLMKLRDKVEEPTTTNTWLTGVRVLGVGNGPLDQLKVAMEKLVKRLKPLSGIKGAGRALIWTLDKEECLAALSKIERLKTLIGLALQEELLNLAQAIKADTSELPMIAAGFRELNLKEAIERRRTVINWFSPLNFIKTHKDIFERRQEGTGQWLLGSPRFKEWLSGSCNTLWCPGIPGAGKTILASIVTDHLRTKFKLMDNTGIASIYCNYKEKETQTRANLLASLWMQLIQEDRPLDQKSIDLYELHHNKGSRPRIGDVLAVLQSEISKFSTVFFVMDAFDECTEKFRTNLLADLRSLQPTPQLMVTSRPLDNITCEFEKVPPLEIGASDEDLATYLKGRLSGSDRLARFVSKDAKLGNQILDTISKKAEKMFLLAQLQMDSLGTKTTPKAVRKTLESLPTELDTTYEDAIRRIESQNEDDKKLAKQVLCWIIYAFRPLTIDELQHALAVEPDEPILDRDNIPDQELLTSVCAGLVIVDQQSETIRLVHHTTQEYFQRISSDRFPDFHVDIVRTCLTYLSYHHDMISALPEYERQNSLENELKDESDRESNDEAKTENDARERLNHSFLRYAYKYWGIHASKGPEKAIQDLVLPFLEREPKIYLAHYTRWHDHIIPIVAPGLHISVTFGLTEVMKPLLGNAKDIDQTDQYKYTALHCAAKHNQASAVQLLLKHGAKVNLQGRNGRTALAWAALKGFEGVVRVLLENQADPNVESRAGTTALSDGINATVPGGNINVVMLLLKHGANVNSRNRDGEALLHKTICSGNTETVLLLLNHNADVNIKTKSGQTSLHLAARFRDVLAMRLLLDHEADVHIKDKSGNTSLHTAVMYGNVSAIQLLLNYGADANATDNRGDTALHKAVKIRSTKGVEKLLNHNVDVNTKNNVKFMASFLMTWDGCRALVERLRVELGKKIYPDFGGNGVVEYLVVNPKNPEVEQLLSEQQPHVRIRISTSGMTALDMAIFHEIDEVVQLLAPLTRKED